ncbi:MAG: DUF362 domain-containing protein [bacterium]|nr:DUF362 domain-containing protein [bacterium]
MTLGISKFTSFKESVPAALDGVKARDILAAQTAILVKPNLVNTAPHPITTSVECCRAIVEYIRECTSAKIIIAEGCGDASYETGEIFRIMGYEDLAKSYDIELIDLNTAPLKKLNRPENPVFPEMYLPEIAFTHYIISVPVLKAHSLAQVTGTLKNMMGFAPPEYYSGHHGIWKKAVFHANMHQAITDLNSCRTPDLSVLDASIGMADYHLGGPECNPPVNKIVAGFDPVEVDRKAAELLGFNWQKIDHLR